ncbi:OmpH family outer membrane protein [Rubrivirga sp. IMCC43871]|uniref:OmpH family outer membrane protein n=1 Tax=Rubrivirga sp. IMCC43871 TaxID=3391575 RepID=UPI00398FF31E
MTLRLSLLAVLAVALAPAALAQPMKVGFVDTDQIVIRMPAFADVQAQLQQQQQAVGARVRVLQDSLQTVFQAELADYQQFASTPLATDAARAEREQALLVLRNDIEQAEVQGLQYLSYAEARLLQPVLNQIDQAIAAEAEAGGYDLVLPTVANNAPVFLYRSEKIVDLTPGIMGRLGIDPNSPPLGQPQAQQAVPPGQ